MGYCYELNGCFAWLLRKLGFKVAILSARVARKNGGFSPEFDHMALLVRLGDSWLADVGFGDSFTEPKQLDYAPQKDDGQMYRIERKNGNRTVSRRDEKNGSWNALHAFNLRPYKLADFAARKRYQQTSPNSHFTQGRLISQLTKTGRVTLTDKRLIVTIGTKRVERRVMNPHEFHRLLAGALQNPSLKSPGRVGGVFTTHEIYEAISCVYWSISSGRVGALGARA